jgi:hypothetical protein
MIVSAAAKSDEKKRIMLESIHEEHHGHKHPE